MQQLLRFQITTQIVYFVHLETSEGFPRKQKHFRIKIKITVCIVHCSPLEEEMLSTISVVF